MVYPSPPPAFDATITTSLEADGRGRDGGAARSARGPGAAFPRRRRDRHHRRRPRGDGHLRQIQVQAAGVSASPTCLARHLLGEETGRVELDAKIARDLFSRPAFAASTEASRLYLNGIFLHNLGDDLAAVATDGYRLCRVTTPATTALSTDRSLIIPNEMVKTINRLLGNASGNVTLRRSERLFAVEGAGFALVTKRIDATYPDYERLIPFEAPNVVTVSRAGLRESLARFAAVADPQVRTHIVSLRWNADGLHLSAPDGSADCLAADVEGEAEDRGPDPLSRRTDRCPARRQRQAEFGRTPGSMILVTDPEDENFTAVQMPVRAPS